MSFIPRFAIIAFCGVALCPIPARAQDSAADAISADMPAAVTARITAAPAGLMTRSMAAGNDIAAFADSDASAPARVVGSPAFDWREAPRGARRPGVLLPLYLVQAALQSMDAYTTVKGQRLGLSERNPLFRGSGSTTMLTTKALSTLTSVVIAEQMWKRNKAAAVAVMLVANSVTSVVVAHNYSLLGR